MDVNLSGGGFTVRMRPSNIQQMVVVIVMLFVTNGLVVGQGIVTGSISGTALDPQGAVVTGASVRATQRETNRVFSTMSSDAGVVQLPSLPPGTYVVTVEAEGFSKIGRASCRERV